MSGLDAFAWLAAATPVDDPGNAEADQVLAAVRDELAADGLNLADPLVLRTATKVACMAATWAACGDDGRLVGALGFLLARRLEEVSR